MYSFSKLNIINKIGCNYTYKYNNNTYTYNNNNY